MVTVITKTIGPTGRDYTTFTLAEADVTNIGTSADLVANDEAIVFEADAGTYSESVTFQSSLTTDATRNVTYKPAAGSEHGGDFTAGVRITSGAYTVTVRDPFTRIEGLSVEGTVNFAFNVDREGITLDSCIAKAPTACFLLGQYTGTAPLLATNCVAVCDSSFGFWCYYPGDIKVTNCTVLQTSGGTAFRVNDSGGQLSVALTNNVVLSDSLAVYAAFGSPTITGSNNFGGATNPFPAALQGSPYPITATTSFSTPLGSGDYAVYMGATGALADVTGNDVWQQGVGPGSNSDVPTTDINGVARSGASCNPGAFEADGFVDPTVLTRTIGPSGRDYATFTLAEAAVTSIGSGTDLTFYNEAIVFEADAATYSETVNFQSSLTTDATRQVTYKAAAGSEHGGVRGAGVKLSATGASAIRDDYLAWRGLELTSTTTGVLLKGDGVLLREVLISGVQTVVCDAGSAIVENSVTHASNYAFSAVAASGSPVSLTATNCTAISNGASVVAIRPQQTSGTLSVNFTNVLILGYAGTYFQSGTVTTTGSNNFGGATNPFPAALQGSPYPITASTAYDPGAGDFALYVSSTGQLLDSPHNDVIGGGVGPAANANVPTTDIVGRVRTGGTTNPGAFAVAQATRVIGKTIGPVGRDYATFTLAEAAVESIATAETGSTDLVAGNARIEFLADAGTYTESVTFSSSLTTDATRQVTYKPASGSEHGGDKNSGVRLSGTGFTLNCQATEKFLCFEGIVISSSQAFGYVTVLRPEGLRLSGCIVEATGSGGRPAFITSAATASNPVVIENGVLISLDYQACYIFCNTANSYAKVVNCTLRVLGGTQPAIQAIETGGFSVYPEFINCLVINEGTGGAWSYFGSAAAGSNNFGGSFRPFPAALQGSPYPITATTDTDPGPGHFAIYDADTGALVNVAANTVWQRGVGPSVNSDVPTTGIAGFTRSGATANPGAFAASTSLAQTTNPVARFFTYKRPSTQLFNHHRRVTCVFPDDGPSGNANTFAVGVAARGFISPVSRDCVAFFVYYTTDGAGGQTSLRLEVARIVGQYSQDAIAEAQPIAVVEKQAVGEAIPAGFNFPGQSHTVAFKVQTFSGATTPESAAEYTAYIDGTAVTFDTFYQSSTQDGTTKVVTHPAPAVGTTQGRAEAFFWYATADRTDSGGSENYSLPQWSEWNQLTVDPDPIFDGEGQSITVEGEGTGTINFSTALEHVDFAISVQYELPRFDTPFASGHRYTSPRFENSRRVITASATNIDKATMDLIVQFHAARKGIEEPFLFNFPIPDTTTSETYTVITVQFADTAGMVYRRDAENIYSVQLNMIELL